MRARPSTIHNQAGGQTPTNASTQVHNRRAQHMQMSTCMCTPHECTGGERAGSVCNQPISEPPDRSPGRPVMLQCCCWPPYNGLLVTLPETTTALLQLAPLLVKPPGNADHWSWSCDYSCASKPYLLVTSHMLWRETAWHGSCAVHSRKNTSQHTHRQQTRHTTTAGKRGSCNSKVR